MKTEFRPLARTLIVAAGLASLIGSGGGGFMPDIDWRNLDIAPWISAQMVVERQVVQAGTPARFEVRTVNTKSPAYAWCLQPRGSAICSPVAGATGATLTLASPTLADDELTVRVTVTDPNGTTTVMALLRVSSLPPLAWRDGDFPADRWTVRTTAEPAIGGPSATAGTAATGGNPDAWRLTTVTITATTTSLRVDQLLTTAVHDLAVDGAILAIDAREDCLATGEMSTNAYIWTVPLLEQGERRYVGADSLLYPCSGLGEWAAAPARLALTAADFRLVAGPACTTGESCPDFGVGGAPIRFGFAHLVDAGASPTAGVRSRGIDNWSLTVWRR